ncbi:MAG: biotin--protein ligase [Candidatus Dormiibacterota bacterium]
MHGEYKVPGGKLVVVDCEVREGRLANVQISGDFFLEPAEALPALASSLDGAPSDLPGGEIERRINAAVGAGTHLIGFDPHAISVAVQRALA